MKRIFICAFYFFVCIQACGNESSSQRESKEETARQARLTQEKAKRAEIIGALKQAQDANDTWDQDVSLRTWTIDLQDRIVGKPIVSSGILVDVWLAADGKHYLHLVKERLIGSHFEFFLTCSKPDKVNIRSLPEYFFVAKVQSIRKDARYTNADLVTGFSREGPRFTIRGECVELRLNEERVRRDQADQDWKAEFK